MALDRAWCNGMGDGPVHRAWDKAKCTCVLGVRREVPLEEKAHRVAFQPQCRLHTNPHIAQLHSSHHIVTCAHSHLWCATTEAHLRRITVAAWQQDRDQDSEALEQEDSGGSVRTLGACAYSTVSV